MEPLPHRAFRGALSRVSARVTGSHFAKPVARVVLAAAGLLLLAFIGQTAIAGAVGHLSFATTGVAATPASKAATSSEPPALAPPSPTPSARVPAASTSPTAAGVESRPVGRSPASPEDPVVLNTATEEDLRRLPGIGAKRASAILALRSRLGRFRAIEDLLKVKGVGRATLKRLRPLVRLDPPGP